MGRAAAVVGGLVIGALAGLAGGYVAWHDDDSQRACSGTERQLAHVLSAEAQGYAVQNGQVKIDFGGTTKPRQLSASELALVRACNR